MTDIKILKADLMDLVHQRDIVLMMDAYSRDPMGPGKPLSQYARSHLIEGLIGHPTTIFSRFTRTLQFAVSQLALKGFQLSPPSH